jgi:hypothetical protein
VVEQLRLVHTFCDDLYLSLPLLSPWVQPSTWRVRTEAEAAALMMRSSQGQLVVDSLRSLRAASSGITAVAESAAGAGSGSRISYKERRNSKHMKVNISFCSSVDASAVIWLKSAK